MLLLLHLIQDGWKEFHWLGLDGTSLGIGYRVARPKET